MDYREAVVVGGGVAGLAAATFIARTGRRVRLFEQAHELGGRARTRNQDGFLLNQGPHALYRGGRGIEILRELGVEVHGRPPEVSGAFAVKNGALHAFPSGFVSLLTTSLFGPGAKLEFARVLTSLPKIDPKPLMSVCLLEWLESSVTHQEVRDVLLTAFRIATYTNAPELMSAGSALRQLKLAFQHNVLYLDGGWQTIVEGLVEAARQAGVTLESHARVAQITRDESGAVSGVHLADGRSIDADNVIVAASPTICRKLLADGERSRFAQWEHDAIPVRAACLDVALRYLPRPRALYAFGVDRPLYLSVHSASARLAPEGGALIHVAKYLSPDDEHETGEIAGELEALLDLVQPGWRTAILHTRFLPDMVVMNSIATARTNGTDGRPGPVVPGVPGLYVAGDWVGSEGMLVDASLASAKAAAQIVSFAANASAAAIV